MAKGPSGLLVLATVAAGLTFSQHNASARAAQAPQRAESPSNSRDWSSAVDGVKGRLIATATRDDRGRAQVRLELELENVRDLATPIEIWWSGFSSMLDLTVEEESGKPLTKLGMGGNEARPGPFWLRLLYQSSVKMVVAAKAYEYNGDRALLRPTTFQGWFVPRPAPPRLFMRGTLTPKPASERSDHPWAGPLILPRIEIPTTPSVPDRDRAKDLRSEHAAAEAQR